jgi:hypothetical protein
MNIQESIRRILKEETQNLNEFISELSEVFEMSDELNQFVKKFISESDCNKIEFSNFKIGALGIALHNFVLINKNVLKTNLEHTLFVIFHEIAHQYQFKKYGEDVMYNCYLGEISDNDAAKFMKSTEEVADEYAIRKIKQLQKMDLISKNYNPPQMYKNVSLGMISNMVSGFRNEMKSKGIDSPQKISEYFYNMVKKEL